MDGEPTCCVFFNWVFCCKSKVVWNNHILLPQTPAPSVLFYPLLLSQLKTHKWILVNFFGETLVTQVTSPLVKNCLTY